MQAKAPKTSTKTHRRSRTGCFTCRLRRKKCDEGKPMCKACKHLGLACEYKRPSWWGNVEQRKRQKEAIKQLIKKTKLSEKVASITPMSANTSHILPPPLSHSVPTSDECYSDAFERARSHSVDSGYSLEYDYDHHHPADYSKMTDMMGGHPHPTHAHYVQTFNFNQPYEYDVLTEKCNYMNAMPASRRESDSSYCNENGEYRRDSTYASAIVPSMPQELYPVVDHYQQDPTTTSVVTPPLEHVPIVVVPSQNQTGAEELPAELAFFDFTNFPETTGIPCVTVDDEGRDQRLLNHFIQSVLQLILPVLDYNLPQAREQFIIPALTNNQAFLHSCLGAASMHLKATQDIQASEVDDDIMRHRKSTVEHLCEAMNSNSDQYKLLESILAVILFQSCAGSPSVNEDLPDIAWYQHFMPALRLIEGLNLTSELEHISPESQPSSFHMTAAAWIDILGATMLGQMPAFANTYREKFINNGSCGLSQLMGCDDKVMYLISEIACLEAHKLSELPDDVLLQQITQLARQIEMTEPSTDPVAEAKDKPLDSGMLSNLMSAAFRCAARIYLTSLVPGFKDGVKAPFDHTAAPVKDLLDKLASILELIPAGHCGFDRSLVWVWLIGGSVATPGSAFRNLFEQRVEILGEESFFGSFSCMVELIKNVWHQQDTSGEYVHWRDVMTANGHNFLLI